jgi:putative membrane protein
MQFLKTLFWVLVTALVLLFSFRNWAPVTISLWDDIQADVKIPVLLLVFFLLGFLPTWLVMRARVWTHRRRIDALERTRAVTTPAPGPVEEGEPAE